MGVKKKHESGFFEDNLINEPSKTNRHQQNNWYPFKSPSSRNIASAHQVNGETNYQNKSMDLLDLTRGYENDNRNNYSDLKHSSANHYKSVKEENCHNQNHHSMYERENMSSSSESKNNKHNVRSHTEKNDTIVISDEEEEDEYTHKDDIDGKYSHGIYRYNFLFICLAFFFSL